ncbi:MAG: hypothetical protein WC456_00185 [Patescibacteria group bacterium]
MKNDNLPNLNESVLRGLDFFIKNKLPGLKLKKSSAGFVIGSVNAYNTGRMLFGDRAAFFADEGNFLRQLKIYGSLIKNGTIKEATIISASGEKDAIWEIKAAKRAGLRTALLTCNPDSTGARLADRTFSFPKSPEPYSYNFSTYLGMILDATGEKPAAIKAFLKKIKLPRNFSAYRYFTFILPDRYRPIVDMINVKDDELFGPYSSLRAYSEGNARHAKFICQSTRELVIAFGQNKFFGLPKNRWDIKLPKDADFATLISASYYLIGFIQASRPPYFKKGLADYCLKTGPKPYGRKKPFPIIVQ